MKKILLSEKAIFHGKVSMPKGFELNIEKIINELHESLFKKKPIFSIELDRLTTYIQDYMRATYGIQIVKQEYSGDIYEPNKLTLPLLDIDPMDLAHSPDFTMLFGAKAKDCIVRIFYTRNRKKELFWDHEIKTNSFVMFPSTCRYIISNNQIEELNIIQKVTYEHVNQ